VKKTQKSRPIKIEPCSMGLPSYNNHIFEKTKEKGQR
jgi:hypothetical protein